MFKFCSFQGDQFQQNQKPNKDLIIKKEELNNNIDNFMTLLDIIDDQLDQKFIQKQEPNQQITQSQIKEEEKQYLQELERINIKQQKIILDLKAAEENKIFEKKEEMIQKFEEMKEFSKQQYFQILLSTQDVLKDNNFELSKEILEKESTDSLIKLQEQLIQLQKWQQIVNFYENNQLI